jgi:hypothetical protein
MRARTPLVLVTCIRQFGGYLTDLGLAQSVENLAVELSGNAQVGQNVDHIDRLELAGDTDRQTFVGELVEHVEHPVLASIVGTILDEVIGPDMIALC